jgi:hypothetical protein
MATTNMHPVTLALGVQSALQAKPSRPALPFSITSAAQLSPDFTDMLSQELHGPATEATLSSSAGTRLPGAVVEPSAAQSTVSEAEAKKIDGVARDMESVLLYTLMKEMWATVPKTGMFDTGTGAQFYREMWLEEVSKRASDTGAGLGIAKVIKRELMDRAAREVTPAEAAKL